MEYAWVARQVVALVQVSVFVLLVVKDTSVLVLRFVRHVLVDVKLVALVDLHTVA